MGLDPGFMHFCEDAQLFSALQLRWLGGWAFVGLEGLLTSLRLSTKAERPLRVAFDLVRFKTRNTNDQPR
jgi:hypothetical protein